MPPAGSPQNNPSYPEEAAYPSRNIAYQAAGMITSIIENLQAHDELRYTPAFIVYSLFSALIMHVYQMRSSNKSIVSATEQRLQVCMNALKEVSKVWLVAKMVHTLFESILGNKHLEERLQKAAGKRHQKRQSVKPTGTVPAEPPPVAAAPKRKFDDMDMGFSSGPPAPPVSYERSRPQTPALTPGRDLPSQQQPQPIPQTQQSQQQMPQVASSSPQMNRQNSDAFMGNAGSRSNTRPTTPFNPSYSYPGTPPELFLVTRNSPNISQDLWQNFQPDQLFPNGGDGAQFPQISPVAQTQSQSMPSIDPALSTGPHAGIGPSPVPQQQQQPQPPGNMNGFNVSGDLGAWPGTEGMPPGVGPAAGGNEETWSNSSRGYVPTTLNVEDWFNFFGIHGDANGLNGF